MRNLFLLGAALALLVCAAGCESGRSEPDPGWCGTCAGPVVTASRGSFGFTVDCDPGFVVGFAGTQSWFGPGELVARNACSSSTTPAGEGSYRVCCVPALDGGPADAGG